MKSTKSEKSIKSVKSMRALKSTASLRYNNDDSADGKSEIKFEEFLTDTCNKFNCPFPVVCKKLFQRDDFYKALKSEGVKAKYKRISIVVPLISREKKVGEDGVSDSQASTADGGPEIDPYTVYVNALYDSMNRLAEIAMFKVPEVPRILMQVLGIIIPFFDQVTKLTIRKCGIDVYTIHELNKFLHTTSLSDICLDESTLKEGNYATLLDKSHIKNLSLCRCRINDKVCKQIASKLHYKAPGEKTLMLLNLSSNHITDEGAKHLADALRSNRHLRYLNLADNRITDDGAGYILDSLMEFSLTLDETMDKRRRHMKYLKERLALFLKYYYEYQHRSSDDVSMANKKQNKKKKTSNTSLKPKMSSIKKNKGSLPEELLQSKAEMMAGEVMGPFYDPFGKISVNIRDGWVFSQGNLVLCYLNLAYNDLTYPCLKKIADVLTYQAKVKNLNETGLLRIIVDGNNLPQTCPELVSIGNLVNKSIARFGGKPDFSSRRKSRATIIV